MSDRALRVIAHCDGGSRGNPGRAACAAVIYNESGAELLTHAKEIGQATNNVAEYQGVILALELCGQLGATAVELKTDSELIARQIEGRYRVKHPDLKPYFARTTSLIASFDEFSVTHVPREKNQRADALVNACLDGKDDPLE